MAYASAQGQLAYYRLLDQQREMTIICTTSDLQAHCRSWQERNTQSLPIGGILAMECADPIVEPLQAEA